jgi:exodeoxyribonuclease VII small subunit
LDESLGIYERAVELRNHCKSILDDGQRRIQRIMETSEGVKLDDFSE